MQIFEKKNFVLIFHMINISYRNKYLGESIILFLFSLFLIIFLVIESRNFVNKEVIIYGLSIGIVLLFIGSSLFLYFIKEKNNIPPVPPPITSAPTNPSTTSAPNIPPITSSPTNAPIRSKNILISVKGDVNLNDVKDIVFNSIKGMVNITKIIVLNYLNYKFETRLIFFAYVSETIVIDDINLGNLINFIVNIETIEEPNPKIEVIKNFSPETWNFPPFPKLFYPPQKPTQPPPTQTAAPISVGPRKCINLDWVDKDGNDCSFYIDNFKCNIYGTQVNLENSASSSECNNANCNTNICSIDSQGNCIPKPISAFKACCSCGGGKLGGSIITNPATIAPTGAPTQLPTTSAPTSSAPVNGKDVLGITNYIEFDNNGFSNWKVPLYTYDFYEYEGGSIDKEIEDSYGAPLPVKLGNWPQLNTRTGKFEGYCNVIVKNPDEFEKTQVNLQFSFEEIEGLTEYYYVFIYSSRCDKFLPLYTPPLYSDISDVYWSYFDINGNPELKMFSCLASPNYNCICNSWNSDSNKYIKYATPPKDFI